MDYERIIAAQERMIASLEARLDVQSDQIARLLEQVELLTAAMTKKKRGKKKPVPAQSSPPEPPVGDISKRPTPPPLPDKTKDQAKVGYQTGRRPLPKTLPAKEEVHRPTTCGSEDLRIVDQVVSEKLDIVRGYTRRRQIVRKTCQCNVTVHRRPP